MDGVNNFTGRITLSSGSCGVSGFVHHILKVSIAQIAREAGYQSTQSAAIETLVQVLKNYVEEIGVSAKSYSELSNRSTTNVLDVANALAELDQPIDVLIDYREQSDSLPFQQQLPHFPLPKPLYLVEPSSLFSDESPPHPPHIPPYLPAFPPSHTYHHTPTPIHTPLSPESLRQKKLDATRAIEQSLVRLHRIAEQRQREISNTNTIDQSNNNIIYKPPLDKSETDLSNGSSNMSTSTIPSLVRTLSSQSREKEFAANPFLQPPQPPPPPTQPFNHLFNPPTPTFSSPIQSPTNMNSSHSSNQQQSNRTAVKEEIEDLDIM